MNYTMTTMEEEEEDEVKVNPSEMIGVRLSHFFREFGRKLCNFGVNKSV